MRDRYEKRSNILEFTNLSPNETLIPTIIVEKEEELVSIPPKI